MRSLGLRRNPTILTYSIGTWVKSPKIIHGKGDAGGIWVCRILSGAKTLKRYMMKKYRKTCRIFRVKMNNILFMNSYRIKTDQVLLLEEIEDVNP